jgi:hypothetical protein
MATFRSRGGVLVPRHRGTVVLGYGLVLLAIGIGTRQAFYLALGVAWCAIGIGIRTRDRSVRRAPRH